MFFHHAYLIEGREEATDAARSFISEKLGITLSAHPDFFDIAYETFGVEESREIKETSSRAPIGERKAILLYADIFTREAQNALLKIFEDPTPNTHFFVVTPYPRALLPTLLSRMEKMTLVAGLKDASPSRKLAEEALLGDISTRLSIASRLHKDEDKTLATRFLEELTELLRHKVRVKYTKEDNDALIAVASAASYVRDSGAFVKMLLEYAVLSLPTAPR